MKTLSGFLHGVNLGGWLSQCNHTKDRYENFIREEDIKKIEGWGLDHIRVPVDYDLIETKEGERKEEGYVYLDRAVAWCRKYGLNMILDLHKTAGFSFDDGEQESGFFEDEKYQERFFKIWDDFAERYGGDSGMLAFELLNEVTDKAYCAKWNELAGKCIKRIRAKCPDIKILVGGYYNNSVIAVPDIDVPYDENIVYNFHCYEPLIFTHQGAAWIAGMDTEFRIGINATVGEMREATKTQCGMEFTGDLADDKYIDENYFEKLFKDAIKTADEKDVYLYCGEYGVIEKSDPAEQLKWMQTISNVFNKHGIGRAVWSYKEMDFGIIDTRLDAVRSKLLGLL